MRVVLASASPARSSILDRAGVRFDVVVSGVDEDVITAASPVELVHALAVAKGESVASGLTVTEPTLVLAADTVLVVDGEVQGKPHTPDIARARWRAQRGRRAEILTGHHVVLLGDGERRTASGVVGTEVWFADATDAEIDAYIASGEPLEAAGAFKIDGRGGALVDGIRGDHLNVMGLSLPLVRRLLAELGIGFDELWAR